MTPLMDVNQAQTVPEWVLVWRWARARGERRVFPHQDEWKFAENRLSVPEYNQLRAEWFAERSPDGARNAPKT